MNISLRLKRGQDDVIMDWFDTLGKGDRSHYIKEALKFYIYYAVNRHNMALPPLPPIQSRRFDIEKTQTEIPDAKNKENLLEEKDLDSILDNWADMV